MTQQISDVVRYEGAEYDLLPAEPWPFDPSRNGLHPVPINTACHAGFFCEYAVRSGLFVLETLAIGWGKRRPPPFNGRRAVKDKEGGYHVYSGLDLHLRYTGSITVGKGRLWPFISYWRSDAPPYQMVLKLDFSKGRLTSITDISNLLEILKLKDEDKYEDE